MIRLRRPTPEQIGGIRDAARTGERDPSVVSVVALRRRRERDLWWFLENSTTNAMKEPVRSAEPAGGMSVAPRPWIVTDSDLNHSGHEVTRLLGDANDAGRIHSSVIAMRDPRLVATLRRFLSIRRGSRHRGRLSLAVQQVRSELSIVVDTNVIKNCIASLLESEHECEEAAQGLHNLETDGVMDFASSATTPSGVLEYLVWAPKGSRTVVRKYGGDVATIDSTHHVT